MHAMAKQFVSDGQALGNRVTAGQFFLFAHGIELALKGFLHSGGLTLQELQNIGHKLTELLQKCDANGLVRSEPDSDIIVARLDKSLEHARLRYDFDYFDMPVIDDLQRVARGILKDTEPTLPPLK
jgi:hypothetical protein